MRWVRVLSFVRRQLLRHPVRSGLTVAGIAVAMFLWTVVGAVDAGVRRATERTADDTTLIVYRENRFCPFASRLPQRYDAAIGRIPGVRSVTPVKIVVSNCRASLDVVTFRGLPDDAVRTAFLPSVTVVAGDAESWFRRGDAALVGSALAQRRRLGPGDRFVSAGVAVTVAAIVDGPEAQTRNSAFVHLPFLQEQAGGGGTGAIVTQFSVQVDDASRLEPVAEAIDELFSHDQAPTSTSPEKGFVARAAADVVRLTGFARWVGVAALLAVFGLVANAVVLAMQARRRETSILQSLGFGGWTLAWMVLVEGSALAVAGGAAGAISAWAALAWFVPAFSAEGAVVEIAASPAVAGVGVALSLLIGLLACAVPAIQSAFQSLPQGFRAA